MRHLGVVKTVTRPGCLPLGVSEVPAVHVASFSPHVEAPDARGQHSSDLLHPLWVEGPL